MIEKSRFNILLFLRSFLFSYLWTLLGYSIFSQHSLPELIGRSQISSKFNLLIISIVAVLTLLIFFGKRLSKDQENSQWQKKSFIFCEILLLISIILPFLNLELLNFSWLPLHKIFVQFALYWQIAIFALVSTILSKVLIDSYLSLYWDRFIKLVSRNVDSLIYILIGIAVLLYFLLSVAKHNNFGTFSQDLGLFDQAIWKYAKFQLPITTIHGNLLAEHFHPILIFLAPFYWLFKDVKILLLLEPLIYCLGALPIFWFAKEYLKNSKIALSFGFAYLFFIGSQYALDYPFHIDSFASTFLIFAFYFLWKKKYLWHFIFVLLLLMVKENTPIYLIFLSVFAWFFNCNKKVIAIDIIVALIWFFVAIKLVVPYFAKDGYAFFNFADFGDSFLGVGTNMVLHPLHTLSVLFSNDIKIDTLLKLFGALGFLPLFSFLGLVSYLPMLVEQFLSSRPNQWAICFHYSIGIAAPLVLASILGLKNIKQKFLKFPVYEIASIFIIFVIVIETLAVRAPLSRAIRKEYWQISKESQEIQKIIEKIPQDSPVAFTDTIGPHLTQRDKAYQLPNINDAEYIVISKVHGIWPLSEDELEGIITNLKDKPEYRLVTSKLDGKILLFKKR